MYKVFVVSLKFNGTGNFILLAQSHPTCPLTAHMAPLPCQVPCKPHFYTSVAFIELQDIKPKQFNRHKKEELKEVSKRKKYINKIDQ